MKTAKHPWYYPLLQNSLRLTGRGVTALRVFTHTGFQKPGLPPSDTKLWSFLKSWIFCIFVPEQTHINVYICTNMCMCICVCFLKAFIYLVFFCLYIPHQACDADPELEHPQGLNKYDSIGFNWAKEGYVKWGSVILSLIFSGVRFSE